MTDLSVGTGGVDDVMDESQARDRSTKRDTLALGKRPMKLHRLHLAIPDAFMLRIKTVMDVTGTQTVTEMIKTALRLYIAAVYASARGEVLVFRRADGSERPVDLGIGNF